MPKKRYTPEEIVAKLRQVDVLVSQGQNIADAIRQIGVSEVTYYRWRQEYGGLKTEQIKRLKELETENTRLRRAVSDLTWTSSFCRRRPGETYKPRAPPRLYPAGPSSHACLRAPRLCGARTAPLDAAQGAAGPR